MLKPIAVQLYSLREEAAKDFVGVLKRVADIGYIGVEPAGLWNLKPAEFKKIIDDLGLKMYSSHTPWCNPNNLNESIEMAGMLGLKKVVCGYGPKDFESLDAIRKTADQVNKMQEVLEKAGLILFQHNHAFEFERIDGRLKYEIYAELCPKVKFEIDCFWSTNFGTEDAVEMLKKFASRTIMLHMKDGILHQKQEEQKFVNGILDRKIELLPLGSGQLDIKTLVKTAPESAEAVVVELDYCNIDMFTAIEQSYKYMTSNKIVAGNK